MRKITLSFCLIIAVLLIWSPSGVQAQCTPLSLPYYEGFHSAPALPNCARSIDGDGDGAKWTVRDYSWTPGDGIPSIASWNDVTPANNWYYTPPLALHKDSLYRLYFVVRGFAKGSQPVSLEVRWGADTTLPDSMNKNPALYNNPSLYFRHPEYDTVIAYFKPTRTTRYYIGFHDNTDKSNYELVIDSMSVIKTESNALTDVQVATVLAPVTAQCPNSSDQIRVVVTNPGTFDAVNIPVTVSYTGTATGLLRDTIAGPLAPGESDTVSFSGVDFSASGMYQFLGFTSLSGDENRGNDTTRFPFEVKALPAVDSIGVTHTSGTSYIFTAANARDVLSYEWNFGDGNVSQDDIATHTYVSAGNYTVTLTASNKCDDYTVTRTLEVTGGNDDPSGIAGAGAHGGAVLVFPNPARDQVQVVVPGDAQHIAVYDGIGRMVYCAAGWSGRHTIATGQWNSGLYLVQISTGQGLVTRRLQLVK